MTRHDEIRRSYKALGDMASVYDGIITRSTLLGKIMDSLVWGLDKELAERWVEDVYASLPGAAMTCLDYSADMMENAQKRAKALGLANVTFVQGDVGALPFADESFDLVLSLNGFHAFPDKDRAFSETCRVLKPGGVFCGCFYIAGEFPRTDWFVRHMYVPKGFFTSPFETKESLTKRLRSLYTQVEVHTVRAEGIFRCVK